MDFDQMLETWSTQNTAPPYDVNRDVLRQALQTEETSVRRGLRIRRRGLWFLWILGTGMAVWAAFWIAITIANGWPAIYAIAAGVSLGMFALAAGASWVGRREPDLNFGNTLQEEARRSLALVDYQLSITRRWIISTVGIGSLMAGVGLFSWTLARSQDNFNSPDPSSGVGWFWYAVVLVVLGEWASYKTRDELRKAAPKLELRQRHLRELLAALDASE
jgi:hypothetical protein